MAPQGLAYAENTEELFVTGTTSFETQAAVP